MILLHLVSGASEIEDSSRYSLSGFTPIGKIEVDFISLTVFPFLNVHSTRFCKVNNGMSSGVPDIGEYFPPRIWWQRHSRQSDKSAEM
jgi:hypothetical protein